MAFLARRSLLVVFGGLPGTGKSTIAREVARLAGATLLRIDTIEQAMRGTGIAEVGAAGYAVAQALAEANLVSGRTVVADAVNPVAESRAAWRAIARRCASPLIEVELVCSDPAEHRRRIETRGSDIPGLVPPTWGDVMRRCYDPWPEPHLVIDTAQVSVDTAVDSLLAAIDQAQ